MYVVAEGKVPGATRNKDVSHHQYNQGKTVVKTNLTPAQQAHVKNASILYQGSMAPFKKGSRADWISNNIPFGWKIFTGEKGPAGPQQYGSIKSTNSILHRYVNAKFNLYGHSQGGFNGQYAFADLFNHGLAKRINNAYFYESPNANALLKHPVKSKKVHLYTDFMDNIGTLGYKLPTSLGAGHAEPMGELNLMMPDKGYGLIGQHMLSGYAHGFKVTIPLGRNYGKQVIQKIVLGYNNKFLQHPDWVKNSGIINADQLKKIYIRARKKNQFMNARTDRKLNHDLKQLRVAQRSLGWTSGSMSASQRFFLDAEEAYVISSAIEGYAATDIAILQADLEQGKSNLEQLWSTTQHQALSIGKHLSHGEVMSALHEGGASQQTMVNQYTEKYDSKLAEARQLSNRLTDLTSTFKGRVATRLAEDQADRSTFGLG
ncbi:hypothetical protein [Limosilactobacillus equigenerosi]|uniref:Fungal lipase-like domain-containing protein n=2 Tax=Limosilactobacillus TaxID=2742598 RepID=A0A0R1UFL5_9LACO|nr:hypothetical protein [Limosilactobacillus equigenerosi]KRL92191.1 hypothetical protein FC21_GL000426 [Limosilactobacillus equigenerosi DSM 18793 = JCM 14505]